MTVKMWKFFLVVNFFGNFLLTSILGIAGSTSLDNVSQVKKAINDNFQKTNGDHPSPNVTLNRANFSHSISVQNNDSDLPKLPNDKMNSTRTLTTYEVQEPNKKHSEREVKIVYEASKSSSNRHPKSADLKNVPYNYNTSIKYSSKYSLIPEESKHINSSENVIEDEEEDSDDEEEEDEEESDEDEEDEAEEKRIVQEKIRENERKIKQPPMLEKPRGTYEEEKRKRLQTERIVIDRVEEVEDKPEESFTEKSPMVNKYTTEEPIKYKKEREELTERPAIIDKKPLKYHPKIPYVKPYKTQEEENFLQNPNLNSVNDKEESKINAVRPAKVKERKSERQSRFYPGQANYIISSSAKINSPQRPHVEHDLKNEQSRYYWRDKENEEDEDEIRPLPKVLPTEPVKILEEEIMTSHPYEDPQPVSFSSVVFNPSDSESTSELSGSYYDKTPNVPNVIRERIDHRVDEEEEEVSENSMEDTKSVPYTTPNYQSIQTPLNSIKFMDTYAFLNPFAEGKNNFPYKYESDSPKVIVYEEKPPVEDVPFRANLFPAAGTIEKPLKPFTFRPEIRHPEEQQSNNEYRLSAEELRQKENDRLRSQNDIAEDEFEQRKPTPPTKIQYNNKPKIETENNEDESPEYRPNSYKQTKLITRPEPSDVEEQYADRGKHPPKADLFNYNISSTRPRYPHQVNPNSESKDEEDKYNQNRPPYSKPYKNYKNEGFSHPAAETHEGDPTYNLNRPPQPKPYKNYKNEGYSHPAASNPESNERDPIYNPNRPPQKPYTHQTVPNLENNKIKPQYNPNKPPYSRPYKNYKNESSRALYNSHLNNIKESNKPRYRNEEENIYSRRPQKFSNDFEEDDFTTPEIKPIIHEITTKSAPKDNKNEQTEIREPVKDNYIEPVNNIFSPQAKLNFESLDENDDMYQQILANIESIFGIRTSSLVPTPAFPAPNQKDTFIPTPIIPVDYQSYLQPQFEGNSYENLKKNEESDDNEENRSEESEDDEDEESDRIEDDDDDESEDESDYDDASDDGSEHNSNVQKVRSTDKPKSKRKLKKKEKYTLTITKPKTSKHNSFKNQIPSDEDKSEEWEEELRNRGQDSSVEVTTASYSNVLKSRPAKFFRKPKYPPHTAKLIIKDVHSSPVDQKVIRVIVPKIIMKDSIAIPTHSRIIIRKEKTGF